VIRTLPAVHMACKQAKLSVHFFSSHYIIVLSFPIVITYLIMSLFPPAPLSCTFYCTRLHCISLVKYCHAMKWDGSQNIKYPSSTSFSAPLSSPMLNSCFLVRTAIFADQVQSLVSSPLSSLIPSRSPVPSHPMPQHPLPQDLSTSITHQ